MNSPETELFHKGNVLYNFARARKAIARGGTVIAVEGYMDVIALAQAGFENAVAPLGTALTENQLELLWRMSSEPVLCFDGDGAGLKAAWRAADMALPVIQPGRTARFALLPEGKDPDDLVRTEGRGRVPAGSCRRTAARRSLVDARDLGRRLRHARAQGGARKDAARADRPHQGREFALSLRAGDARAGADLLRQGEAKAASGRRMGQARPGAGIGRAGAGRPVREARRSGKPLCRVGKPRRARRWSSAPAA